MATEKVRELPPRSRGRRKADYLPQSAPAESAVIGCILIDPSCLDVVRTIVASEDFYTQANREIMEAICGLDDEGIPADYVMVHDELERLDKLDDIGGEPYLGQCTRGVPSSANVEHYARIVARTAAQRAGLKMAADVALLAQGDAPTAELLEYVDAASRDLRVRYGSIDAELLPIKSAKEVKEQVPPVGILGDVLYEKTVAILYGPSGRWKTFVGLGMAASLADGSAWLGRPAHKTGHVLYIAAEGGGAIGKRIRAWEEHHGREVSDHLHVLEIPVNLLHAEHVDLLIRSIGARVDGAPVAVFIDTLSRSMEGGDGNSDKDGSTAMAAAYRLRDAFDCTVVLLAHPGKDAARGIRGWSGYFQWADTVIRIESTSDKPRLDPGDVIKVISDKPKDAEPFEDICLTAQKVSWTLQDGVSTASSLVMVAAEDAEVKLERLPVSIQVAIAALQQAGDSGLNRSEIAVFSKPYGIKQSTAYGAVADLIRLGWVIEKLGKILVLTEHCPYVDEPMSMEDL